MRALLIPLFALSLCLAPAAQAAGPDEAGIRQVMDAFHAAVVSHDGTGLASLFIPEGGTWLNVLTEEAYAPVAGVKPKVREGSHRDFANFVSTTKSALDPRHDNIRIVSDGTVASVTFDFHFFIDGVETNRGLEMWQLVKDTTGWRIVAITYSSTPTPTPRAP
ncbi:YybH family protein [Nitrospirillum amazonense]|uniref:SnoaL-like protein n=1 Tax=Nitrospirillum amazonense TaxID=28077 RepID=A0A560JI32_9PROT|nr:nuclear transport factor 2 family protein [Nitrospirillum amazonense]MDG3439765.1 nuclear transport factor 2 family protein [Nitrospirillum amazonense]TWB70812.1 SnoaL-like protein [Nitrospirillum amazonense]